MQQNRFRPLLCEIATTLVLHENGSRLISQYGRNAHRSDRSGHELRTGTFDPLLPFKIAL
jgi:hypothetical protein